jgi:mannose-6-phosphate isomerase-like protein (cupin superfamily)
MKKVNWEECEPYLVHGDAIERSLIGIEGFQKYSPVSPKLTVSKKILFFNYAILSPGKRLEKHFGNQEEIYYIIKGNGIFYCDQEKASIKSGDAVYIPIGLEHGLDNNGNDDIEYLVLGTTPDNYNG